MIISGGQNVFAVEVTDAPLPRTPTGKVTKFVLVEQYSSK
jgi:acyl-CoA synthetase (AMP-forming)/AMP-acid ligase II